MNKASSCAKKLLTKEARGALKLEARMVFRCLSLDSLYLPSSLSDVLYAKVKAVALQIHRREVSDKQLLLMHVAYGLDNLARGILGRPYPAECSMLKPKVAVDKPRPDYLAMAMYKPNK